MKRLALNDLADLIDNGKISNLCAHCYKCNKVLYPTENEARKIGSFMARKGKGLTRPYRCPKCIGWHLTSKKI
jgi:hypothetical protein